MEAPGWLCCIGMLHLEMRTHPWPEGKGFPLFSCVNEAWHNTHQGNLCCTALWYCATLRHRLTCIDHCHSSKTMVASHESIVFESMCENWWMQLLQDTPIVSILASCDNWKPLVSILGWVLTAEILLELSTAIKLLSDKHAQRKSPLRGILIC